MGGGTCKNCVAVWTVWPTAMSRKVEIKICWCPVAATMSFSMLCFSCCFKLSHKDKMLFKYWRPKFVTKEEILCPTLRTKLFYTPRPRLLRGLAKGRVGFYKIQSLIFFGYSNLNSWAFKLDLIFSSIWN